jgi:nitrogenase molybdenum-iron protein alpha/beta subunit
MRLQQLGIDNEQIFLAQATNFFGNRDLPASLLAMETENIR